MHIEVYENDDMYSFSGNIDGKEFSYNVGVFASIVKHMGEFQKKHPKRLKQIETISIKIDDENYKFNKEELGLLMMGFTELIAKTQGIDLEKFQKEAENGK